VAGTKRGAHLALTLERLGTLAPDAPQRIGLSATQKPLEEIARFLGGCDVISTAEGAEDAEGTNKRSSSASSAPSAVNFTQAVSR
jgi:ATP-dependent Lhr-like helicase